MWLADLEDANTPHWRNVVSGQVVTRELIGQIVEEEYASLRDIVGADAFESGHWADARRLFAESALSDEFPDFLTLPAYAVVLASED